VAGGYSPHMETVAASGNDVALNKDTYGVAIDLSTINYPYWNEFLWDIEHTPGPEMYRLSEPAA
jgi:hypothetical protein